MKFKPKKFPLYCPKGKHIFTNEQQVLTCECKNPHKHCADLKFWCNDLLIILVGDRHARIGRTNSPDSFGVFISVALKTPRRG